jgi:fructokinase
MILVCGEALIDLFVGRSDGAQLPTEAIAGGSPFNVAIGVARLGSAAAFLSALSQDAFGTFLAGRLAEAGVGMGYLHRCPERSTLSVVATGPDGHPHYTFYGEAGADRALTARDLPSALPDDVKAIAAGSYALGIDPIAGAIEVLLQREAGRRVISLDPNVRPRVVGDVDAYRRRFEKLLTTATLVKASIEDLELLYGARDLRQVARDWLQSGPSLVVVTRGSDAPLAMLRDGTIVERPARRVAVVDTVGAGDSFHSALLAHLDRTDHLTPKAIAGLTPSDVADTLDFAVSASAITCTRRGANPPTWSEVEHFMRSKPLETED